MRILNTPAALQIASPTPVRQPRRKCGGLLAIGGRRAVLCGDRGRSLIGIVGISFLFFTLPLMRAADEKVIKPPEGEFERPEKGAIVGQYDYAKGRTKNVPRGFVGMVFATGERGGLFPLGKGFRGNRRFYLDIYHSTNTLTLFVLPKEAAEKLEDWREKRAKSLRDGVKLEDITPFEQGLLEDAVALAVVSFIVKK